MIFTKIDNSEFNTIYNDMIEQFPAEELKSYDRFCELINSGKYIINLVEDGGSPIGYVIFSEVNGSLWLDYFAVFKKYHSKGYGSRIIKALAGEHCKGIYLEVEKPDEDVPNTIRRIKFYKNLGAEKLDYNYFYPAKDKPFPMDLYYLPYTKMPLKIENDIKEIFEFLHSDVEYLNR